MNTHTYNCLVTKEKPWAPSSATSCPLGSFQVLVVYSSLKFIHESESEIAQKMGIGCSK